MESNHRGHHHHQPLRVMVGGQQSLGTVIKGHKKLEISLQRKTDKDAQPYGIYFPFLSFSFSLSYSLVFYFKFFFIITDKTVIVFSAHRRTNIVASLT